MSQEHRRIGSMAANIKAPLHSYQHDLSSEFVISKSQAPFESIQKVYQFINKKKRHDSSSHKSVQFPPDTKFFSGNAPYEEERSSLVQERKAIRSISRPKSGENLQNIKGLQQSRSFNSLSNARNLHENPQKIQQNAQNIQSAQNVQSAQNLNKQKLGNVLDRDARRVHKYLLPKGRPNNAINSVNSYSFEQGKEETRFKKSVDSSSQGILNPGKNLPYNKIESTRQETRPQNTKLSHLRREDPTSLSFSSLRHRPNFSNNNSIFHDHSHGHVHFAIQEDHNSSGFNFESPIATNRAAQEIDFPGKK